MRALPGIVACALAACGDNVRVAPDAAIVPVDAPPPPPPCTATFAGNFAATVTLPPDCAQVSGDTVVAFDVPTQAPATVFAIDLYLPAMAPPGTYSSESVPMWSADATVAVGNSRCDYVAGASSVPPGDFTLMLAAIEPGDPLGTAHGTLAVELALLPGAETDCGPTNAETLNLSF